MLYGRTCRNEPSRFLNEIEPEYLETTRSPALDRPMRAGWGGGMGASVPGGGLGLFRAVGLWPGRLVRPHSLSGREYNAAGRRTAFPGGAGISRSAPAPRPAAPAKSYQPGDVVMHKVFGRGVVTRVTPAAGDFIVEIRFDKVGVKKTMANYAPLTKVSEG